MLNRRTLCAGMLAIVALTSACVRSVKVPRQLAVDPPVSTAQLLGRLKPFTDVSRIQAVATLRFRDLRDAGIGRNKEYPGADGTLVLSRPANIRLLIKAPFVGKRVADMVSDGTKFTVKVLYPEDKRKFLIGTNAGRYRRVESGMQTADPALQRAGALANIRPQHLTAAFLMAPLDLENAAGVYVLDEERRLEPGLRKDEQVIRTFYVLTLLERTGNGAEARVVRRLWFDRCKTGTPLARQDLYEDGRVATTIRYEGTIRSEDGRPWVDRVAIERVDDLYAVDVLFAEGALTLDGEVPDEAFTLGNDENLEVIDLDRRADLLEPAAATRP